MNLKQRFALYYSLLFSVILAVVLLTVYTLFASFREQEFKDRLEEKGKTTARLLVEVQEIDYQTLKIIDRNTINSLYKEKILIFDSQFKQIYSSLEDAPVSWSVAELKAIRNKKYIYRKFKEYDIYGMGYSFDGKDYYILVAAEDTYGYRKLTYLRYLLSGAFAAGAGLVWILSYRLSGKMLLPLSRLKNRIVEITDQNLNTRLPAKETEPEIATLTTAFNQMIERIDNAYKRLKEFNSNASHELRTPVARIIAQLENLSREKDLSGDKTAIIKNVLRDSYQLSDVLTSLLVLSDIGGRGDDRRFVPVRIDELIFYVAERLKNLHPDFRYQFEIETSAQTMSLEVMGDESLLRIAIDNLLRNAYSYSGNGQVTCLLRWNGHALEAVFINKGSVPETSDTSHLFEPFTRGLNALLKEGTGLGLSIVKRILQYHHAGITYHIKNGDTNEISINFSIGANKAV